MPPISPSASPRSMRVEALMAVSLLSSGFRLSLVLYCVLSNIAFALGLSNLPARRHDCSASGSLIPSITNRGYSLEQPQHSG